MLDVAHDAGSPFPSTRYSAVTELASDDPVVRTRSYEVISRAYWKPVLTTLRFRLGKNEQDAADLCQGFFTEAFEKRWLERYDREKARFRTFVRVCVAHYAAKARRGDLTEGRGGGAIHVDLDSVTRDLASGAMAPDEQFDKEWVRSIFTMAVEALQRDCAARGREAVYRVFARYELDGEEPRPTYAAIGAELGLSTTTVTNHLALARRELRRHVLEGLRSVTASEEEFRDEARELLGIDPAVTH